MHALKEMTTHSSVLAWRIPGIEEPGGLLSMGSHGVGHWSDLAAAAAAAGKLSSDTLKTPAYSPAEDSSGSIWESIAAHITFSNKRLIHDTDDILVSIGLIPLFCISSEYGWRCMVLFGYSTWAESIGFSFLGFWVLRHVGIKFGWSRAVHRLCSGEKDGELSYRGTRTYHDFILPSRDTQLFVSERY